MIDIRKLKELVKLMVENDLSELDLRDQEETVTLKRGAGGQIMMPAPVAMPSEVPAASAGPQAETAAPAANTDGLQSVASPMVGTFYTRPNPDDGPFVEVGSSVSPGTTVCLVEAMKVFNEVKSDVSGTIERILVSDGDAVEFGQDLFLVRPS